MKHSPQQYRIFSGRLANTEKEEATFNFIKKATNLASNHHPANVIANAMIKMEPRKIIMDGHSETEKTESKLTTIYQPIKSVLKNTIIPYTWITKYKYQYQFLLQSQADFRLKSVGGENWKMVLNFLTSVIAQIVRNNSPASDQLLLLKT